MTLGILRHQEHRRNFLAGIVVAALLLLFLGSTWLAPWLGARPWFFIVFWFACLWLTTLCFLLAAYDLLAVRKAARDQERQLRQEIFNQKQDS